MPKPHHFVRRLSTAEAHLFLDELFLSTGLRAESTGSGYIIQSRPGNPILRVLNHTDGQSTLYFSTSYFKEPSNGIA